MRRLSFLVLMLALVVGTQYWMVQEKSDVLVTRKSLAGYPVDHYSAVDGTQGVVLVAHGFGGSKEQLQHWGYTLARQGFDAYLIDQPGHGEQRIGLRSWQTSTESVLGRPLQEMIEDLLTEGAAQPGRIALIGQGMGGLGALTVAPSEPGVKATVALLGEGQLQAQPALAIADASAEGRIILSAVHPLALLYDPVIMESAVASLHELLGTEARSASLYPFPLLGALIALTGGLGALIAVAAMVRPPLERSRTSPRPLGFMTGLAALAVALLSAVLGTVYLRLPDLRLHSLDYILPYFLVAAFVLLLLRLFWPREFAAPLSSTTEGFGVGVGRGLLLGLAFLIAVVPVIQMNLTRYLPNSTRLLPLLITAIILWLYGLQEEGLKQAVQGQVGPLVSLLLGLLARVILLATWIGASALPNPPTYIGDLVPVMLVLLVGLELLGLLLRYLRHTPVTIATLHAVILAWTLASTLPLR